MAAARTLARSLLSSQVQAVLATATREGAPSTHLMAYAHTDDLRHVYVATGAETRKALQMLSNPSVSLLWDNRTGNLADHGDGVLVTAAGRAALLEHEDRAAGLAALEHKNPNMSSFLRGGVSVFSVGVETYSVVRGYDAPALFAPTSGSGATSDE